MLRLNAREWRLLVELEKMGKECNGVDEEGQERIDVLSGGDCLKQMDIRPMATSSGRHPGASVNASLMLRGVFRHSTPVHSVTSIPHPTEPGKHKILLPTSTGPFEDYDHIIMACHSITTRNSQEGRQRERWWGKGRGKKILGGFKWTRNPTVLQSDVSAFPRNERACCAGNYVTRSEPPSVKGPGRVNSDNFALQARPCFRGEFEHPMFNAEAERCQKLMRTIQNTCGILCAGAWMGHGFHEDGFRSTLTATVNLGGVTLSLEILSVDLKVEGVWMADVFNLLEKIRAWMAMALYWILSRLGIFGVSYSRDLYPFHLDPMSSSIAYTESRYINYPKYHAYPNNLYSMLFLSDITVELASHDDCFLADIPQLVLELKQYGQIVDEVNLLARKSNRGVWDADDPLLFHWRAHFIGVDPVR
ncbi:hypothetical protein CPB86DRAFT_802377 [Serendipita vermifera]|nr:hypothetical protein CPB86DRAFT_802377 [Serendipita vermifera]